IGRKRTQPRTDASKALALQELHHDVWRIRRVIGTSVEDLHDVLGIDPAGRPRLLCETLAEDLDPISERWIRERRVVRVSAAGEELDRDVSTRCDVERFMDDAHSALPEGSDEPVLAADDRGAIHDIVEYT